MQELFKTINDNKKKTGVTSLKKLMSYTKKKNEMFKGEYHQDAHEFSTWLLNQMNDILVKKYESICQIKENLINFFIIKKKLKKILTPHKDNNHG